ncbi:phenazine biosynthesis FMN-dependent oxidase PhzG [Streptomyces atratus]|uniref:phenazine biosynthesis FMN-dependent oxidase PhzG n=1 Tax=Streptomyces atratus TaxID=1893 RepID=UPI0022513857|nr:phenazine biosynthesis FMN-dependent oxidase PhzG [Streptomyces atratus]MCX5339641.1 phenazine biosynthesis FMN-dependent oxidase PhzG [Streptomyces atratus]
MSALPQPRVAEEFSTPPAEPMDLLQAWFDSAVANAVREPGALALASADARGHASNRIVQVLTVRDTGLVFASHADSRKGRDLAETGWASGVFYWREAGRQVSVSGPTRPLPDEESDALWAARPVGTHPMSVASHQSAPLLDEDALREQARELGRGGSALPRPDRWLGYLLEPASVEFWQADQEDRLHQRLHYERDGSGWRTGRLQP